MCYNSRCAIVIKTNIDGQESAVCTFGSVKVDEKVKRFDYCLDNDKCALIVDGDAVEQARSGSSNIKLTFREKQATECVLKNGSLSGTAPIFTESLKEECEFCKDKSIYRYKLSLRYNFVGKRYELDFIAKYKLEE